MSQDIFKSTAFGAAMVGWVVLTGINLYVRNDYHEPYPVSFLVVFCCVFPLWAYTIFFLKSERPVTREQMQERGYFKTIPSLIPMNRIRPVAVAFLLLLFAVQCRTQNPPVLSGHITVPAGYRPVVYLIQPRSFGEIVTGYAGTVIDSAVIGQDGQFVFDRFTGPEDATFFELVIQTTGSRYATQLTDESPDAGNYLPMVLKKGMHFTLRADGGHLLQSAVTTANDPDNAALRTLIAVRGLAYDRFLRGQPEDNHDTEALLETAARLEHYRQPLMAFADTTQSFYAALLAIRWVSPDSDYERVPELVHQQCRRWQKEQPEHPFTRQLCAVGAPGKLPLMVGDTFPDFALPTSQSDTVMLYSILGKKLTIIDLWASWCAPCRRENRQVLVPLWEQYHNNGVQIVGYALDSNNDVWQKAIQKDSTLWPQTSHLSGDSSPFLDTLHVTTIPANFILDHNGIIIAKNVHGDALKKLVQMN